MPSFVLSCEAVFGADNERLVIRHDAGSSALPMWPARCWRPARPVLHRVEARPRCGDGLTGMKPLEGLKVLELARILAGPWVGQLLADLGADVVKVERPGAGDDTRGWGPPSSRQKTAAISPPPISTPATAANVRSRRISRRPRGRSSCASLQPMRMSSSRTSRSAA